ncbi:MAG TPA: PRC-barrel domain-containing protein [Methanomassiliicoccaceae archaeon]|nr:PRC-barrel domain-containing protein [Methanomassiliicoccaceae archaeon]
MLGLEDIIGLEVVSSDARVVGTVEGVGIDVKDWRIKALRVGLRRGLEEQLGVRRHMFSVEKIMMSTEFVDMVSDTVIMHTPVSSVSETVRQDDSSLIPVGGLLVMRVICRNARSLGTVDNILFDPQGYWPIRFLQVKLDREAVSALDLQQSLLNAPLVPVRTVDIRAMGDMIMLDINLEDLRRQIASAPAEGATDNHP